MSCMQRVEDLLDLKFCTDGVQRALHDEDYEQVSIIKVSCKSYRENRVLLKRINVIPF